MATIVVDMMMLMVDMMMLIPRVDMMTPTVHMDTIAMVGTGAVVQQMIMLCMRCMVRVLMWSHMHIVHMQMRLALIMLVGHMLLALHMPLAPPMVVGHMHIVVHMHMLVHMTMVSIRMPLYPTLAVLAMMMLPLHPPLPYPPSLKPSSTPSPQHLSLRCGM